MYHLYRPLGSASSCRSRCFLTACRKGTVSSLPIAAGKQS